MLKNTLKPKADAVFHSYWWRINFEESYCKKVNYLIGYSKWQGHDESMDKKILLMNKIVMMTTNPRNEVPYIKRATHIEFFKQNSNMQERNEQDIIVTIFKRGYLIAPRYINDGQLNKFLTQLYSVLNSPNQIIDIKSLIPKARISNIMNRDDMLDINKVNIDTPEDLQRYCTRCCNSGFIFGQVMGFYIKYRQFKNWY